MLIHLAAKRETWNSRILN